MTHRFWLLTFLLLTSVFACRAQGRSSAPPQDVEQTVEHLIGKTIGQAIRILNIDSSQFGAFDEPPMIVRGIHIDLSDTCVITLYTRRTFRGGNGTPDFSRSALSYIIHKKIIGVSWAKSTSGRHRTLGEVIPYYEYPFRTQYFPQKKPQH